MARLLIPTRNRPTSLLSVVRFLERFHPDTQVIVADGSSDAFAGRNLEAMSAPDRTLAIEYRRYPYELGFFDRILDVLEGIDDPLIVMGSDDDYPLMDTLAAAEAALGEDPAAVTAMGAMLSLQLDGPDALSARLVPARTIGGGAPAARMRAFAQWSFPTTYAVTRRTHLIERYRRAREVFLLGFFDFAVGLHDCAAGGIIALPSFGYIATRNYSHSYLRPGSRMLYTRHPAEIARLRAFIAGDLVAAGPGRAEAEAEAAYLMHARAMEHTGHHNQRPADFERGPMARDPFFTAQLAEFRAALQPGTDAYARLDLKLAAVRDALVATANSADNRGEAASRATLDEQRDAAPAARPPPQPRRKAMRFDLYSPVRLSEDLDPATLTPLVDPFRELVVLTLGGPFLAGPAHTALSSAVGPTRAGAPVTAGTPGLWGRLEARLVPRLTQGLALASLSGGGPLEDWAPGGPLFAAMQSALPGIAAAQRPPRFIVWHQDARHHAGPVAIEQSVRTFAALHTTVTAMLPEPTWIICRGAGAVPPGTAARHGQIWREVVRRCINTRPGPDFDHIAALPAAARPDAAASLLHDTMRTLLMPPPLAPATAAETAG